MSYLWFLAPPETITANRDGRWARRALAATTELVAGTHLRSAVTPDGTRWVVVGPPSLRVNGEAVPGIAVLADRDVIGIDGETFFFSTESLAEIVPFPVRDRPVLCARCRTEIAPGTPAVACPQCGLWYHQAEDLPCWSYAPTCMADATPTALAAGFRFLPEEL